MNTQTQEALKMAMRGIESMFNAPDSTLFAPDWLKIYNACKEALEQTAQEPSKLKMAGFDLDGVIADGYREGLDNVSLSTIKRVRKIIADYVEQPAQEPVAWISVKDKLPDVGVEVLTYDTHHEKKYFLNSIIIDKVDKFYFNGFTHWMPLPSAPKEQA